MTNKSVVLDNVYNHISNSLYNEIITNSTVLFSYVGKTTDFLSSNSEPLNSLSYEIGTRDNIVFCNKINPNDISFVANRIDWISGNIYDEYDNDYHGRYVSEIDVISQGSGYTVNNTKVYADGGNGKNLELQVVISGGKVTGIVINNSGNGYTSAPFITIVGDGTGATATATISSVNLSHSGSATLRGAIFFVLTDEYNVYKCISNNSSAPSTVKPNIVSVDNFTTADGYVWKFMYHIPSTLRRKFLTANFIPVFNVLSSSYFSDGGIDSVNINSSGSGYTRTQPLNPRIVGNAFGVSIEADIEYDKGEIINAFPTSKGRNVTTENNIAIKSAQRVGNIATITTETAHNLVIGTVIKETVNGLGNAAHTITSVPSNNTYVYANTGSNVSYNYGTAVVSNPPVISIASISRISNVVTVVTSAVHKLNEGNVFVISGVSGFNGSYAVDDYIDTNTFSFTGVGDDVIVLTTGTVTHDSISITSITRTSNVVTLTTEHVHNFVSPISITSITRTSNVVTVIASAAHNLVAGDSVIITGATGFDGTFTVLSGGLTSTHFTYNEVASNATLSSTGNVNHAVTIANVTGYSGTFAVTSIIDKYNITYSQTGVDDASFVRNYIKYNTGISLTSNLGASGKYGNTAAILFPNITKRDGTGSYTIAPLVYIKGATGTGATATANISGGSVTTFSISSNGSGYTSQPNIYYKGGTPNCVDGTLSISGGIITAASISNGGIGYTSVPLIAIVGDGTGATATATIANGIITAITITSGGSGYTTASLYFSGTSDYCVSARPILYNGKVDSIVLDSIVDSIAIIDPGKGYNDGISTSIDVIGDGTGARLFPVIRNGQITGVTIGERGTGYSYADLTIDGDGSGANLSANVNITTKYGQLDTFQYSTEVLAIKGTIDNISIVNGGSGYTSATVNISGNGSGATATATISGGVITKIVMNTVGNGYTFANATISGDGTSALLKCAIAPFGGHGSNAVTELFADKLMIYTKISNDDTYNGFGLSSDFFQYGLLKNPTLENSTLLSTDRIISPCYSVSGSLVLSNYVLNDVLRIVYSGTNYDFTLVDIKPGSLLLQRNHNYDPKVGDVITNTRNSIPFTITSVAVPTMDRNSGEMIDINNVNKFYKTSNQIIALRNLISL